MAVYLIRAGDDGPVKIGHAINPRQRLLGMQTASPARLSLLGVREGGQPEEKQLHQMYAPLRQKGEWFAFCPTMMRQFSPPPPVPRELSEVRLGRSKLEAYLEREGISLRAFAELIGVTKSSAHRYVLGTVPPRRVMAAIVRETSGQVQPGDFYDLGARAKHQDGANA